MSTIIEQIKQAAFQDELKKIAEDEVSKKDGKKNDDDDEEDGEDAAHEKAEGEEEGSEKQAQLKKAAGEILRKYSIGS